MNSCFLPFCAHYFLLVSPSLLPLLWEYGHRKIRFQSADTGFTTLLYPLRIRAWASNVIVKLLSMSDSLQHHRLQHARPPWPPLSPRVCSNSSPLSLWCHLTIPPSAICFFCLQSFPASRSFPMSQPFTSGSQSIGASALASFFPMNIQSWSLELTGLISFLSTGLESSLAPQFKSINSLVLSLLYEEASNTIFLSLTSLNWKFVWPQIMQKEREYPCKEATEGTSWYTQRIHFSISISQQVPSLSHLLPASMSAPLTTDVLKAVSSLHSTFLSEVPHCCMDIPPDKLISDLLMIFLSLGNFLGFQDTHLPGFPSNSTPSQILFEWGNSELSPGPLIFPLWSLALVDHLWL